MSYKKMLLCVYRQVCVFPPTKIIIFFKDAVLTLIVLPHA